LPVTLDIPGINTRMKMRVHKEGDRCVSREIRTNRIWEPYETSLLLRYLRPGGVLLDIGANIGYYTVLGAVLVGKSGRVIAYEPDEENYRLLEENLIINGIDNVHPFQLAVADYNGSADIYLSKDNRGDHRLFDCGDGRDKKRTRVVKGGEHFSAISGRVDFIKIDTQGSEYHVIKGFQDVIFKNRKHLAMVVELWPYGLRMADVSADQLLTLLSDFDMAFFVIDHLGCRLAPIERKCLQHWVCETEANGYNEGFMNLMLLPKTVAVNVS